MSRMIYDRRNNVTIEETITYFAEKIEKIGPEHHVLHQCIGLRWLAGAQSDRWLVGWLAG